MKFPDHDPRINRLRAAMDIRKKGMEIASKAKALELYYPGRDRLLARVALGQLIPLSMGCEACHFPTLVHGPICPACGWH